MVQSLDDLKIQALAEMEWRKREGQSVAAESQSQADEERRRLEALYDWYALSCPCNLPAGECEVHPRARAKQRPPAGDWRVWFLMAGRFGGKTFPAAQFVRWNVERGHWKEILLVNATIRDTIDIMVEGPSGLLAVSPPWTRIQYYPSKTQVIWYHPDGSLMARAYLRTSEEPGGLRGPNIDGVWADELGKWQNQEDTWQQVMWTMRRKVTPSPRCVVSGTPTPTPVVMKLVKDADREREHPGSTGVHIANWHTRENVRHVDPTWLRQQTEEFEGTLTGEQELAGKLVMRRPGALWGPEDFAWEDFRLLPRDPGHLEGLEYVGVSVDPGAGSEGEKASEAGIIVGGRLENGPHQDRPRGVILEDRSTSGHPSDWGKAAVRAYHEWGANEIVAEKNNGGEMVSYVLQTIPAEDGYPSGRSIPVRLVHAAIGKTARAEPIQSLYRNKRVHHVRGGLSELEQQMMQFIASKQGQKLDRVDALVWLLKGCILDFEGKSEVGGLAVAGSVPSFQFLGQSPYGY